MRLTAVAVLALVLPLSACGGSSFPSAQAVAEELGCEDAEPDEVVGSDETLSCSVDGNGYRIAWFADDDSLRTYRQAAENVKEYTENAGEDPPGEFGVVFGDNWGVECLDTSCDEVVEALGGERI
ncbi:hypothetical protein [Aeromicrobium sp. Leaf350]|uniref:hypothetical protein n=1 Tax=Aeromicrobium sp. Leaf350 TaxID=2876565 RepID=UPI001E4F9D5D|nr:hypothetical protein [Aeromicrobium sp. Leaf350]